MESLAGGIDLRFDVGILELLGGLQVDLYSTFLRKMEIVRDADSGISGFSSLRAGMLDSLSSAPGDYTAYTFSRRPHRMVVGDRNCVFAHILRNRQLHSS